MADADTLKKSPCGFIIYRGDYKDDAKWERFMAYLRQETRWNLESDGTPEQWDRMDWKVISSPELQDVAPELQDVAPGLQDVEPERNRVEFNEWLESEEEEFNPNSYPYRACLYIDECCLDCHDVFMRGKALDTEDPLEVVDTQGFTFAVLVSRFEEEGWVVISTGSLMPRAGQVIMHEGEYRGWAEIYVEEGEVAVDF